MSYSHYESNQFDLFFSDKTIHEKYGLIKHFKKCKRRHIHEQKGCLGLRFRCLLFDFYKDKKNSDSFLHFLS